MVWQNEAKNRRGIKDQGEKIATRGARRKADRGAAPRRNLPSEDSNDQSACLLAARIDGHSWNEFRERSDMGEPRVSSVVSRRAPGLFKSAKLSGSRTNLFTLYFRCRFPSTRWQTVMRGGLPPKTPLRNCRIRTSPQMTPAARRPARSASVSPSSR